MVWISAKLRDFSGFGNKQVEVCALYLVSYSYIVSTKVIDRVFVDH